MVPTRLLAAAVAALPSVVVGADGDVLELFAEYEMSRDDNVFRLADGADAQAIIGTSERGDMIRTTSAGLSLDLPLSRQRLRGAVVGERVRFDRFDSLDLDGHRVNLDLEWVIGDRLDGTLSYANSEVLASLANVQGGVQQNSANFLTTARTAAHTRFKLDERWRIGVRVAREDHDNSAGESRISDARLDTRAVDVTYETRAGSRFGVSAATTDATLPNRQVLAGEPVDNSYREQELLAFATWPVTAETQLSAEVGRVERRHDDLPGRDFADSVYSATVDWRPTSTLDLSLSKRRGISPWEQVNVGFVLLDSLALRAYWRLTEKISLSASRLQGDRRYLGDPGLVVAGTEPRTEDFGTARVGIEYEAADFLVLGVAWQSDARDASVALGDYDTNLLSVSIRGRY